MWWLKIFSWFSGLDIAGLAGKAVEAYSKSKDTTVALDEHDTELVKAHLEASIQEEDINASVLKAEQGSFITRMIRPLGILPFIIYIWKLVVWDKVLGLGVTDPLNAWLYGIAGTMFGSYYIGNEVRKSIITYANRK